MSKKKAEEKGLIAQLKEAIQKSGKTLYRIGKDSDVGVDQLYRFMSGERGLNILAVEKLCHALDLQLVPKHPKETGQTEPADPPEPPPEKPGRRPRKGE